MESNSTVEIKEKVYVCVLAAGKGRRMNMKINKVYYEIGGIPVLARTLLAFERNNLVDGIILVVNQEDIDYCRESIVRKYNINKLIKIVAGGKERYESSLNGVLNVPEDGDIILIHDGARPFVTNDIIRESIIGALEYGAACACVPVRDTVKVSDINGFISQTPNRSNLYLAQTPQSFQSDLIKKALDDGFKDKERLKNITDDSQLVEALGYKTKIVNGSYDNIKITTQEDLDLAELIAKRLD